jgi:hypothetical protein
MASPRRSQARLAYSGAFAAQPEFGTALDDAEIDTLFTLLPGSEPRLEIVTKSDEIIDCTGQFVVDEIVLAKSSRLSFEIEADALIVAGLLGWIMGEVSGADILMLGESEFQPPPTSFVYGHKTGIALKFKDMVGGEIKISGAVTERIKASVVFQGNGSPEAVEGFDFGDCTTSVPMRFSDGAFELNNIDRMNDLRNIEFSYSNKLLADEDPFTAASVDIARMERDDMRDNVFTFTIFGEPGDALHLAAINYEKMPLMWQIGPNTNGIQLIAASTILKQGGGPGHTGQARRSTLGLIAQPRKIEGDADTPVKATVVTA